MKTSDPEIHLIPYLYRGQIIISFDTTNGTPARYDEKGYRVYDIRENGTLKTQFTANIGIRPPEKFEFYLLTDSKETIPLQLASDKKSQETDIVVSDVYILNNEMHYFVDTLKNMAKYKNPAIDKNERTVKQ